MEEAEERREVPEGRVLPVLLPEVTARVLLPEAERAEVEGARVTPEERRDPTTEERVEAPVRAVAPLRRPVALVALETLFREAEELRVKLL